MIYSTKNDTFFMGEALKEAKKAFQLEEVPVGCVIVKDNEIIARAHNLKETKQKSTAHAEILAIDIASKKLNSWRLEGCDIYITLEPCIMCSGAIINSRIERLVYATKEPKYGAHESLLNVFEFESNHQIIVETGILESESNQLLKDFFKKLRSEKN
ncbi:MAG: nucleoside deaminase [Tenericutes bacterium]|nr:nucleoside deaminase [Mycoplasmatota bacterium]